MLRKDAESYADQKFQRWDPMVEFPANAPFRTTFLEKKCWFLTKKIMETAGPFVAREFLLLGDPMSAARLHDFGAVARVAGKDALETVADALISRLAANAPLAMRSMKTIMNRQASFLFDLERGDSDAIVAAVYDSADAVEGVAAKVEKRTPTFTGK